MWRNSEGFPILHTKVHGHPLVYLDNAADFAKTADRDRRHRAVLRGREREYSSRRALFVANRDGGVRKGTGDGAGVCKRAQASEIIFTRGTTEAINLVAQTYGRAHVGAGDEF